MSHGWARAERAQLTATVSQSILSILLSRESVMATSRQVGSSVRPACPGTPSQAGRPLGVREAASCPGAARFGAEGRRAGVSRAGARPTRPPPWRSPPSPRCPRRRASWGEGGSSWPQSLRRSGRGKFRPPSGCSRRGRVRRPPQWHSGRGRRGAGRRRCG